MVLTCLFVAELLFYRLTKKYYSEPRKIVFWLTVSGIIGYLYSVYVPFRIPWNVDVALTAIVFYEVGNLFRKIIERAHPKTYFLPTSAKISELFSLSVTRLTISDSRF